MADFVIGGRRAALPRPWRAGAIAVALLVVALVVAWFIYRRAVAYDIPDGEVHGELRLAQSGARLELGASSLEWQGGIAVLRVTGDAHAIGAAHGRLLAPVLPAMVRAQAPAIEDTVDDSGLFGGTTHRMRLAWRWRFVDDGLGDSDRRMVAGLMRGAAASGVSLGFADLVRDQAVLDVGVPSRRTDEAARHQLAHSLAVIAAQSQAAQRVWIGRTFALSGLADGGDAALPVVTIAHPDGRLAWAGVAWPGELGVVTGINAEGLVVLVDPARTSDVRPTRVARPVAMLARMVLEQAKSIDEAVKLVEQTPTLGAALFVIVDGASGRWVIVERTPQKAIVEKSPKLPAIGDVLGTNALAADPDNERSRRVTPTLARVERAARLVRAPLADAAAMAAVLRDRRGTDDAPRPLGHRGAIDDGRASHVAIIDPAAMQLWVADPRANGRMRAFDLRHELRGEGDRATPPAEIPADPEADPVRAGELAAARADLRDARDALGSGDRDRAAEACDRARGRVPLLPEALELCALVAQARGDTARARALFQQWLDAVPDDPLGEEAARAALVR